MADDLSAQGSGWRARQTKRSLHNITPMELFFLRLGGRHKETPMLRTRRQVAVGATHKETPCCGWVSRTRRCHVALLAALLALAYVRGDLPRPGSPAASRDAAQQAGGGAGDAREGDRPPPAGRQQSRSAKKGRRG